uniref:Intraflagellar transport associated protein n=1 Tax=Chelydra serpentina TaxID=8475 RepID=A0A8C3RNR8_CHESE
MLTRETPSEVKRPSDFILDQFINSQEQTYEEFLSTFTYLWKGMSASRVSHNKLHRKRKRECKHKERQCCLVDRVLYWESGHLGFFLVLPLTYCVTLGKSLQLSVTESSILYSAVSLVLPGEVEQTATCYTPSFDQPTNLEFGTLSITQPSISKTQELCGDEVQLLSLDEEFDYDNVALTPKFSAAEMKAIINLSEQKKVRIGLKSPGYED